MALWNAGSGTTLATVIERSTTNLLLPVANDTNPSISLISGQLPPGLRLEGRYLVGTPFEVERDKVFEFVLRATEGNTLDDRTFKIIITGPDSPSWKTAEGTLPIGTNNAFFVLDNALVDFQLIAIDPDIPAGDTLVYYIGEGEGELPPGLTMSESGRITGIVEPLLSLELARGNGGYDTAPYAGDLFDYGIKSTNGYASYYYDVQDYDYSVPTKALKKLNRYYPFTVTVSDGDNVEKRDFIIYLVGDDYLRADNTIMQAGTGVFTADNTYLRNPVWLTPSDLGYRRANNYVTLYLDVIQNDTLAGDVYYSLEKFNLDGSPSILPPGLELDRQIGEIVGRIPYQPAITEEYTFTVKAERFEGDLGTVSIYGTFYEDTLLGNDSFKIYNLDTSLADNVDDLKELRGRSIRIANRLYQVVNVDDGDSDDYDIIFLDRTLSPEISLILSQTGTPGNDHIFVQRLSEKEKEKYNSRTLKFTDTESYTITDIYPYIEYRAEETVGMNLYVNEDSISIKVGDVYAVGDYASYNGNVYRLSTGDTIDSVVTGFHTILAQVDGSGATVVDAQGNPIPNFESGKWTFINNDITNLSQTLNKTILKQKLERLFPRGTAYITNPIVGGTVRNDIWSIRIPATSDSRNKKTFIDPLIQNVGSTVKLTQYRDNEDFIKFNTNLTRILELGRNIGIALFRNEFFSVDITVAEEDEVVDFPSSTKQFSVRIIGEIDSTINWITPADLGTIPANFISTLSVQATTTVPDSAMLYTLKSGKLPNGLRLNLDGQIIGKPRQFPEGDKLGLTTFDLGNTGFDGTFPTDTTFDRQYRFVIEARDRFGLSAIEREFILTISAEGDLQYSNIYVKPFLKPEQRLYYTTFISNPDIFTPSSVYRPDDPEFGVQSQIKMLVYAGIETKEIREYVAASAKHHKRRKFKLGEIRKAVAKFPGETDTVYEVIYINVIDPSQPAKGQLRKTLQQKSGKPITVDSIQYAVKDDNTNTANGSAELGIYGRETVKFIIPQNEQIIIGTRNGDAGVDADFNDFEIEVRAGGSVEIIMPIADAEPFRFRPVYANTIKADTDAVKVSQTKDNIKYISNIDNMRDQIETVGEKERLYLPLWMRTPQGSTFPQELDYVTAIPLCFCKPGTADDILLNIKNSGFDVTNINFDIDRYIIDQTTGNSTEQYILFANYQFNV